MGEEEAGLKIEYIDKKQKKKLTKKKTSFYLKTIRLT
jgi:hypothetical protein